MATKRYKISKDQLERVVENFVMEAASIESKKAPVKNHIPSQSADAKKHVKNKMSGKMVEKGEGVPATSTMKKKLPQAHDAKKHISKAKATHSTKAKVVKEGDESGVPNKEEVISRLKKAMSNIDKDTLAKAREIVQGKGANKENLKGLAQKAVQKAQSESGVDHMSDEETLEEGLGVKGTIGIAALALALTGLGIKGEMQSQIIDQMNDDGVIMQVLKDPLWLGSILSAMFGVGMTVSAHSDSKKEMASKAVLDKIAMGKRKGFTEIVSGDAESKKFPIVLKNPSTGKSVAIESDGTSKVV